ncbi:MAG TPA: hypothetical protein VN684_11060 [Terriglobales bacterium]|nr:hypothetical protein [Terriglobales bacterium]
MILGMSIATYTLVHVAISLIGIFSGFIVLLGLLAAKRLDGWTVVFLTTTVLTSVTGFGFPFTHLLPSHKLAIISLAVLTIAILARYAFHMKGAWRSTYVVTAMIAFYLNVFVLVVQSFEKVPALKALAPTQSERPFVVAQLVVLTAFVLLIILAVRKFSHGQQSAA